MPPAPKRPCSSPRRSCRSRPAPRPGSAPPSSIMSSAATSMRGASPTPGGRERVANGRPGGVDFRSRFMAPQRFQRRLIRLPAGGPARRAARASRRRLLLGGAVGTGCGPSAVGRALLRAAALSPESFYGLVARETLGMETRLSSDPFVANDPPVGQLPNVKRATELARIGEPALAEEMLRHQAKIGNPSEHHALIQTAKRLDLAGGAAMACQPWPARRPLRSGRPLSQPALGAAQRLAGRSRPRLRPHRPGIRVPPDRGQCRRRRRPDAGAAVTAQEVAQARNVPYSRATLTDPRFNLEYRPDLYRKHAPVIRGRRASFRGSSPPTMPAQCRWRAGPGINDKGDPLLWIESIPYWETRYYVPAVMRNMWVYQGLNREDTTSLMDMAQHRWPAFPSGDVPARALGVLAQSSFLLCSRQRRRLRAMPVEFEQRARSDAQRHPHPLQPQGARRRGRLARPGRGARRRPAPPNHGHHRTSQVDPDPQQLARHRLRSLDQCLIAGASMAASIASLGRPTPIMTSHRAWISNRACS